MSIHRERVKGDRNPTLKEESFEDGTITHMRNFFDCIKTRREPNAPVEAGIAAARAGHIGNLAYHCGCHLARASGGMSRMSRPTRSAPEDV